jgi:hypothetical protein
MPHVSVESFNECISSNHNSELFNAFGLHLYAAQASGNKDEKLISRFLQILRGWILCIDAEDLLNSVKILLQCCSRWIIDAEHVVPSKKYKSWVRPANIQIFLSLSDTFQVTPVYTNVLDRLKQEAPTGEVLTDPEWETFLVSAFIHDPEKKRGPAIQRFIEYWEATFYLHPECIPPWPQASNLRDHLKAIDIVYGKQFAMQFPVDPESQQTVSLAHCLKPRMKLKDKS